MAKWQTMVDDLGARYNDMTALKVVDVMRDIVREAEAAGVTAKETDAYAETHWTADAKIRILRAWRLACAAKWKA